MAKGGMIVDIPPKLLQLPLRLQECEEVQGCIDMVLRCLIKGLRWESERAGRLSAGIADWLLQGYTALSTDSSPEVWAKFLQVGSRPMTPWNLGNIQEARKAEHRFVLEGKLHRQSLEHSHDLTLHIRLKLL